jgi:hypothetical protein
LEIKVVAWDGHKRNMAGFTFVQSSEGLRRLLPGDPRLSIVGKEGCSDYIVKMEKTKILKITQERKVIWGENLMYMYIDFNDNLMCMMKKITVTM